MGFLTVRRVLFWMHLVAGSVAGLVILVMSVTGVLLMYEKQLVSWADDVPASTAVPAADKLPLEALLQAVRGARPAAPATAVAVSAERGAPVTVTLGGEGVVFVDPYDGRILGEGSRRARAFF